MQGTIMAFVPWLKDSCIAAWKPDATAAEENVSNTAVAKTAF